NGGQRMISTDDPDYQDHYVDKHIKNVTSDFDPQMNDRIYMTVHYENGQTLELPMGNIPINFKMYINGQGYKMIKNWSGKVDHLVRRKGLIYPVDLKGTIMFTDLDTPNLVAFRSSIYAYVKQAALLLEIAELVYAFSGAIKMLGNYQGTMPSLILTQGRPP